MEKRIGKRKKIVPIGLQHPIKMEYYETIGVEEDKTVYGIEIVKREMMGHTITIEGKVLKKVSEDRQKNIQILDILMKNDVTPLALEEIVEDLVKQK